jgi:hypothetical protein
MYFTHANKKIICITFSIIAQNVLSVKSPEPLLYQTGRKNLSGSASNKINTPEGTHFTACHTDSFILPSPEFVPY